MERARATRDRGRCEACDAAYGGRPPRHRQQHVAADGLDVCLDEALADVVVWANRAGWRTVTSCEAGPGGDAYVGFARPRDLLAFVRALDDLLAASAGPGAVGACHGDVVPGSVAGRVGAVFLARLAPEHLVLATRAVRAAPWGDAALARGRGGVTRRAAEIPSSAARRGSEMGA